MSHPRPDPHTDGYLDALARPWAPPANDWHLPQEDPLAQARGMVVGCGASLAFLALVLLLAWCWR